MSSITQINTTKVIKKTFSYYSFVIFVIIVAAGLIGSVILLTNIFINPPIKEPVTNTQTFDTSTINRLNVMSTSDVNSLYQTLPSGRINPFSE